MVYDVPSWHGDRSQNIFLMAIMGAEEEAVNPENATS